MEDASFLQSWKGGRPESVEAGAPSGVISIAHGSTAQWCLLASTFSLKYTGIIVRVLKIVQFLFSFALKSFLKEIEISRDWHLMTWM